MASDLQRALQEKERKLARLRIDLGKTVASLPSVVRGISLNVLVSHITPVFVAGGDEPSPLLSSLHSESSAKAWKSRSPVWGNMDQFLNFQSPSEEEMAKERAALRMVQEEVMEADEANLLEEEDMHVFDREPLQDALPLVTCNACQKPVKASQYTAHAERCQALCEGHREEAVALEAVPERIRRKGRKRTLSDAQAADNARVQFLLEDDAIDIGCSALGDQGDGSRVRQENATKRTRVDGAGHAKPGRPRKLQRQPAVNNVAAVEFAAHEQLVAPALTVDGNGRKRRVAMGGGADHLDVSGCAPVASANLPHRQRPGPCGPVVRPLATKQYCLRHSHRLRTVVGSLFRECLTRARSASMAVAAVTVGTMRRSPVLLSTSPPISLGPPALPPSLSPQAAAGARGNALEAKKRGAPAALVALPVPGLPGGEQRKGPKAKDKRGKGTSGSLPSSSMGRNGTTWEEPGSSAMHQGRGPASKDSNAQLGYMF